MKAGTAGGREPASVNISNLPLELLGRIFRQCDTRVKNGYYVDGDRKRYEVQQA